MDVVKKLKDIFKEKKKSKEQNFDSNDMTYHRRQNVLPKLLSSSSTKETLPEKASLLQKHDVDLFGNKFGEHLVSTTK